MIDNPTTYERPAFLDALSDAYSDRGKSVIVLTGDTHDLFWSPKIASFLALEQTIFQALSPIFTVIRLDIATGIGFYDDKDVLTLQRVASQADALTTEEDDQLGNLKVAIASTRHSPLPALVLLQELLGAVVGVRRSSQNIKPICTIVQFAGSLFPTGDFDRLAEIDRQRLVTFLNLIESPWFKTSNHLIILIAETRSEVSTRITALPSVQCIEIELPNAAERDKYTTNYMGNGSYAQLLAQGQKEFVSDTAGLTLTALQDLLEGGKRTGKSIGRQEVLSQINTVMEADLGDIIKLSRPEHGPKDIIGYKKTGEIFLDIFRRCENPETAVPAILVSGPNGSGKTFQLEAYASESGRVVIELAGLRGMYFGQTDTFFEKLRLRIKTYGKILILMDEAHTQFGSVHRSDTHETEKRLAGNIIKMMGDRSMFGKVLWGLMTSRPDELDPDVKSRAPVQIPIFDLEGDERKTFVTEMFARQGVPIPPGEVDEVLKETNNYAARDYDFLVKEMRGSGRTSVLETLQVWQASASILKQRRLQTLLAAQHCSYPALLPQELKQKLQTDEIEQEVQRLKALLQLN
jgi:ATPase family associated with various cellular activities (AAA)